MRLQVNGVEYGNFVQASAEIQLDALANQFSFEASSKKANPLPFRGGESCTVLVDGATVITGTIEIVNVDGGAEGHTIRVQGRDRTGDLIDSSIGVLSDIRPRSLKELIEKVIEHLNPTVSAKKRIQVIDLANLDDFNPAEDLASGEPGENAFDFIEAFARKRQVLLTSNALGDVVITASSQKEIAATIQNRVGDSTNNVLSYSVSYDETGRFREYASSSQLNLIPLNEAGTTPNSEIVSQGSDNVVLDTDIRKGRRLFIPSESMFSTNEGEKRARWEANIRKARGRVYSAVVHGYRNQTGDLWRPNTLVKVNDEYAGIRATMLINSTTFALNEGTGRTTSLGLVERNAYTLELEEPTTEGLGFGLT